MVCKKHGWKGNGRRFDFGALGKSFVKAFWAILSPAIILGGIPRDYSYSVPKKVKRLALKSVLSAKVSDKEIIVLDELKFDAPRTKDMVATLANVGAEKKALIVTAEKDENVVRSAANIKGVKTTLVGTMNVYDILNHTSFIVTKAAVEKIEEVYA